MSRCKSCDNVLTEDELILNPKTKLIDDMCKVCKGVSYRAAHNLDLEMEDDASLGEIVTFLQQVGEDWDDE